MIRIVVGELLDINGYSRQKVTTLEALTIILFFFTC